MSTKGLCHLAVVSFLLFAIGSTALGWGGPSHAALCQKTFDDPVLQPFLSGIDQSAIENYTGEPPGNWHSGQWTDIVARSYIDTAGVSPSGNNWNSLDETTRLKYLMHNTTDVGVPMGHSPANQVFVDSGKEAYLELQVSTWSTYPTVAGTTYYTHTKNGYSEDFDGTRDTIINKFYNACLNNATWSKNNLAGFPYFHDYNDYRAAGWNGTTIALMLQRVIFVDYFLGQSGKRRQFQRRRLLRSRFDQLEQQRHVLQQRRRNQRVLLGLQL
jgi:hypothetical protein